MQEAKEYFNTYVSPMLLFGVCAVLCLFVTVYFLLKKLKPQIGGEYFTNFSFGVGASSMGWHED